MDRKKQSTTQGDLVQMSSGLWVPQKCLPQQHIQPRQKRSSWTEHTLFSKTLWEWMSLLLVPLLIGIGTIFVTAQQTFVQNALNQQLHDSDQRQYASDLEIAQQERFNDLLKIYRDGIDTLLLANGLRTAPSGSDVRRIAHSRTLDVLQQVDAYHKSFVITYLADLGLIQGGYFDNEKNWHKQEPIVSLHDVDLSEANLEGVAFRGADLKGAKLLKVYLSQADFTGADLTDARLVEADLTGANLEDANLKNTMFSEAEFSGGNSTWYTYYAALDVANLKGSDLKGADLRGINLKSVKGITAEQLSQAFSLSGTIMPDGKMHACKDDEWMYCQSSSSY